MISDLPVAVRNSRREPLIVDIKFCDSYVYPKGSDIGQKLTEYIGVKPVTDFKVTLYSKPVDRNTLPLQIAQQTERALATTVLVSCLICQSIFIIYQPCCRIGPVGGVKTIGYEVRPAGSIKWRVTKISFKSVTRFNGLIDDVPFHDTSSKVFNNAVHTIGQEIFPSGRR